MYENIVAIDRTTVKKTKNNLIRDAVCLLKIIQVLSWVASWGTYLYMVMVSFERKTDQFIVAFFVLISF